MNIKHKPTLTPSMLDAWDLYVAGAISREAITNRLLRVEESPTLKMLIGIAYHNLIQTRGDYLTRGDEFALDMDSAIEHGLDRIGIGCEHEVPLCRELGDCMLSGRVDGIALCGDVHEYKTSENAKGYLDYMFSPQWLAYAYLTGCKRVTYHVVRYLVNKNTNVVYTTGLAEFSFSPPRHLTGRMHALTSEILNFADNTGISIC